MTDPKDMSIDELVARIAELADESVKVEDEFMKRTLDKVFDTDDEPEPFGGNITEFFMGPVDDDTDDDWEAQCNERFSVPHPDLYGDDDS